jgi:hypothetical protein
MPRDPEINWSLSPEKANLVIAMLAKQPFENVADLITDLQTQARQQMQAQQARQQMPLPGTNGSGKTIDAEAAAA